MTRTAVRRRVDLDDGRLVIRRIVVETSDCREVACAEEPQVAAEAGADRGRGIRGLKPGTYRVRRRQVHLI